MQSIVTNLWPYGITGDRLAGVRNSEVYQQSLKDITNFLVTDIGSLKVAKTYTPIQLILVGDLIETIETTKGYYLIITTVNVYAINNTDQSIKQTIAHGMNGAKIKASIINQDKLAICDGTNPLKVYSLADTITVDSSFKSFMFPVKEKKVVQLDLWKVSKNPLYDASIAGSNQLRVVQMSAFTDPLIKVDGGKIYLHNSEILINRVYTSYNAAVDIDYFNAPKEGEIYGIMRIFEEIKDGKQYIVDNTNVVIGELTDDAKYNGKYFTSITGTASGIFTYGQLIPNINQAEHVAYFQDRLWIYKDNYFYASKIGEYHNFRNDVANDSAFFFQLNPIGSKLGNVIGLVIDVGMYVLTTVGVYIIGFSGVITPGTIGSNVIVASSIGATKEYTVVDNSLFYLNKNGILKVIILDRSSQQLAFDTITVDKYSNERNLSHITKLLINDREYVAGKSVSQNELYLIESVEATGIYRKTKIELDLTNADFLSGLDDKIITNGVVFVPTDKNYRSAKIFTHPMYLGANSGIMYTFDNKSMIRDIVVKMLNEDNLAIKGLIIGSKNITNLPNTEQDKYNLYRQRASTILENGFGIEVITNENDKVVELLGIQTLIQSVQAK
ncbi:MAG: hypothetical protein ACRCX2_06575 [Paraclostridium sp.]